MKGIEIVMIILHKLVNNSFYKFINKLIIKLFINKILINKNIIIFILH